MERTLLAQQTRETAASGVSIVGVSGVTLRNSVISDNDSHGVSLSGATDTWITGNSIGTVRGGASGLANTGSGVHIAGGAADNKVEENVIAFNDGDGVTIESPAALRNTVWENAIHSNTGLGIDLAPDGVTANDAGDADAGPNGLQNFPTLTAAVVGGEDFEVVGGLSSTASARFVLDFYSNTSCDASSNGEGQVWPGYDIIFTDATCNFDFTAGTLSGDIRSPQTPVGNYITATRSVSGDTSEFSACIEAGALPTLDLSVDTVIVAEGGTATYTVELTAQPASDVTVSLESAAEAQATVSPPSMTFTGDTWDTPQRRR